MGDDSLFFSSSSSSASSFLGSSDVQSGLPDSTLFFCELVSGVGTAHLCLYGHHHFLDACFLCKRPIKCVSDVFMYGGDAPFCSEECRQEQIEMDVALEKCRELSSSIKRASPSSTATTMPTMSCKPNSVNMFLRCPTASIALLVPQPKLYAHG